MSEEYTIRYPRRRLVRRLMTAGTRLFMRVFARMTVTGQHNIPRTGPAILVGNHVAFTEVPLMCSYTPRNVEMVGVGDIPPDPFYAPIINAYGFIRINRGSMDRKAMSMALDVLKQGGVVGIFPEGGIWEKSNLKQARTGVSWLSSKGNAPIVPIGFGGMVGSIDSILSLKRPQLNMHIGEPLPPVQTRVPGKTRKEALTDAAEEIMQHVEELIPSEEKARWILVEAERFTLELTVYDQAGAAVEVPADYRITYSEALAKFFHRPVILRTMARNLKLPVRALRRIKRRPPPANIYAAVNGVLGYLEHDNPFFLSYRFGVEQANAMQDSLRELGYLAAWCDEQGYTLAMNPIRHYRYQNSEEEITETVAEEI